MKKIESFIPENFDQAQWHSVSDDVYIFGTLKGKIVDEKFALVKRNDNGSFDWAIADTQFQGNEPNKSLAQQAVEQVFYSAINYRETLK